MEKLHLSDDQMRTFLGDYGSGRPGEKVGVAGTTNTHVLGKGRPGEKVGVERTTRTEYVLGAILLTNIIKYSHVHTLTARLYNVHKNAENRHNRSYGYKQCV